MKKNLTLFLLFLITSLCFSQQVWKRTLSADSADMVFDLIAVDDGYVMTGSTNSESSDGTNVLVVKTDLMGEISWANTYGDSLDQSGLDLVETSDNGYLILGETSSPDTTGNDIFLLKINASGDMLWSKTYQGKKGEYAAEILVQPDGFLITGYTWSFSQAPDYLLCQVDISGNLIWSRYYEAGNNETCFGATLTSDNHILMVGSRAIISTDNSFLLKADISGNVKWAKAYGGNGVEQSNSIIEAANGDYLFAGSTQSFGSGSLDAYLVRTDTAGNEMWTRSYGTASWESAYHLMHGNNEIILGGEGAAGDYYLLFIDDDGIVNRERTSDNEGWERSFAVAANDDLSSIVMAGFSASWESNALRDIYLVKTNNKGADCQEELGAGTVISTTSSDVSAVEITTDTAQLIVENTDFTMQSIALTNDEICSKTISVTDNPEIITKNPVIYPNPADDRIFLEIKEDIKNPRLKIYNSSGQLVHDNRLKQGTQNNFSFDVSNLPAGIYNVIINGEHNRLSQTITIE